MKIKLSIAALVVACAPQAQAGPVFSAASYTADVVFRDVLSYTTMPLTYDGTSYWSTSGGYTGGLREARYDAAGVATGTFSPGLDFRSIFTDGSNNVLARQFSDGTIYRQTSPGVFASSGVGLAGLDNQSAVALNSAGQYVAMKGGDVRVYDAAGALASTFKLNGYYSGYVADRGIAAAGAYLFTYFNQVVSAWDYTGALIDSARLSGAGTGFDSYYSFSYANNRFFVVDGSGGNWRGFNANLSSGNSVPEPSSLTLSLLALGTGLGVLRRRAA